MPREVNQKVLAAVLFAQTKHREHFRTYTYEPYFVHLEEVARILERYDAPDEVVMAAYLHDTIEDTDTTREDLEREFGSYIAQLVWEVTDQSIFLPEPRPNRKVRKAMDRDWNANASYWGQSIKYGDMISNTESIVTHDKNFARVYLKEKGALLDIMTGGHLDLRAECLETYQKALEMMVNA